MNDRHEYKLIEGTFPSGEAQALLGGMLKSKIDFHTLERHSLSETAGDTARSAERLAELRELDAKLKRLFTEASARGGHFRIFAKLEIEEID